MAEIRLEQVQKRFGRFEAIRGVSTTLRDGCLTVIVGPSGSGKTTLLRSIAGLESIDDGGIVIDGNQVADLPPKDRDVAFVFQNYALYAHMDVRDNIAFPLRARGVHKAERRARADEVAGRLGLEAQLDKKPGELSGGQQQRVAIGRAIIREPAAFLFDEPLSNLDAQLRIQLRHEIIRLREDLGATAVWVTHDQEEAMAMGDEIIVFNEGEIAQQAPPDELYTRPANLYVAKTIGSPAINLIEGQVNQGSFEGPLDIRFAAGDLTRPVVLGLRPEDLHLVGDIEPDQSIGEIEATVELIERLGPRAILTMRVGSMPLTGVFDRRSLRRIEGQETIRVTASVDSIHLFDAATENRIEPGQGEISGSSESIGVEL